MACPTIWFLRHDRRNKQSKNECTRKAQPEAIGLLASGARSRCEQELGTSIGSACAKRICILTFVRSPSSALVSDLAGLGGKVELAKHAMSPFQMAGNTCYVQELEPWTNGIQWDGIWRRGRLLVQKTSAQSPRRRKPLRELNRLKPQIRCGRRGTRAERGDPKTGLKNHVSKTSQPRTTDTRRI